MFTVFKDFSIKSILKNASRIFHTSPNIMYSKSNPSNRTMRLTENTVKEKNKNNNNKKQKQRLSEEMIHAFGDGGGRC